MKLSDIDISKSLLGKGGFSKYVNLAFLVKNRQEVAVKCIEKSSINNDLMLSRLKDEIKIQDSLSHPLIVQLIDYFEDENAFIWFLNCVGMVIFFNM